VDEPIFMLTTRDNPYNPFTHYDEWDAWDTHHGWHLDDRGVMHLGYCTSGYLGRVADTAEDGLSPAQYTRAVNDAYDEIVKYNLTGNYVKVTEDDYADGKWVPSKELTYGASTT